MAKRFVIEGLLDDYSGAVQEGRRWSLHLFTRPWRDVNGEWKSTLLRTHVLTGRNPGDFERGTFVRLAVTTCEPAPKRALVDWIATGVTPIRKLRPPADLPRAGKPPPAPRPIVDRALGRLRYDAAFGWYAAWRKRGGATYEVSIASDADTAEDWAAAVAAGSRAIVAVERRLAAVRVAIAAKMVPIYNRGWRDGAPRLTATALRRSLSLQSIAVQTSGRVDAIFDCGDHFTDHGIEVRITARGKISEIGLA